MNELIPKNGLYLTREDNETFSDMFSRFGGGLKKQSGKNSATVTFVVTEQCNLNCTYCYEKHKTEKKMSFDTAKTVIDQLLSGRCNQYFRYVEKQGIILEFIGGEPLLEIELIDQIVEYFKETAFKLGHPWAWNYMISFSSNGVLFFAQKVQEFLTKNAGKVSMGISVDGDKKLHDSCRIFPDGRGSYEIAARAAKALLRNSQYVSTKATLSPENVRYLFRAMKSLREEIGYHFINCNCVFEEGWTLEHAKIFYSQLIQLADYILDNDLYHDFYVSLFDETLGQEPDEEEENKNWCGGNGDMLAVDCDGKFFSCLRFMQFSLNNQKEQSVGDIRNGFLVTPEQKAWCEHLQGITMKTQSNEECRSCPVRKGCAICLGYNYDRFGDPNHRATFICIMHKARICANGYYWNRLYKKLRIKKQFVCNTENIYG